MELNQDTKPLVSKMGSEKVQFNTVHGDVPCLLSTRQCNCHQHEAKEMVYVWDVHMRACGAGTKHQAQGASTAHVHCTAASVHRPTRGARRLHSGHLRPPLEYRRLKEARQLVRNLLVT